MKKIIETLDLKIKDSKLLELIRTNFEKKINRALGIYNLDNIYDENIEIKVHDKFCVSTLFLIDFKYKGELFLSYTVRWSDEYDHWAIKAMSYIPNLYKEYIKFPLYMSKDFEKIVDSDNNLVAMFGSNLTFSFREKILNVLNDKEYFDNERYYISIISGDIKYLDFISSTDFQDLLFISPCYLDFERVKEDTHKELNRSISHFIYDKLNEKQQNDEKEKK